MNNLFVKLFTKSVSAAMRACAFMVVTFVIISLSMPVACAEAEMVRPAVGKPLQTSQALLKDGKYQEALAALNPLAAIPDNTPYEIYMIDRTRVAIASASGDDALSIAACEAIIQSGRLPATEQAKFIRALASLYNKQQDYKKTISLLSPYPQETDADPKMRALLTQAYYRSDDFVRASQELQQDIQAEESLGRTPTREALLMLSNCAAKLDDKAGYVSALEKLVAYYPTKEAWGELIYRLETRPAFSPRLLLDIYRLRRTVGELRKAVDFMEMARLALNAGFPAEAKDVLNQGFDTGILGTDADAIRHKRMRELATKKAASDLKTMHQSGADAARSKDGSALIGLGYEYVTVGEFDQGISLMEQGLRKADVKHADDAKLHLAYAYVLANRKAQATQLLKNVQSSDGARDLARYWLMYVDRPIE
jgi:predicted Zn-dependent protease